MYKTKEAFHQGLKLYLSSSIIYGLGLLFCRSFPYYQKTLNGTTQNILLYLYLSYLIISPIIYYFRVTKYSINKPYLFLRWIFNIIRTRKFHPEPEEKTAGLFLLVKIFFLPLMINFLIGNLSGLLGYFGLNPFHSFPYPKRNIFTYSFLLTFIFTLDTFIFAIGYAIESRILGNVVRSVEPTFLGWFVALICYPPFNSMVGKYIPWGANDYAVFWNPLLTNIMQILIIFFLIIYVWATLTLGLKASNLTNRGIVQQFPYSIIRHPAYISKNLVWWLTLLPVMSWPFALGMGFWTVIYFLRAWTEERHLSLDSDYVEYKKKVKWRFIPYLF